jgi:glycosidase
MTSLGGDIGRAKLAATLLLTLPGLPFVYYGEEIGMTGDKPDPRLRTPMQWSGGPGVGFTSGAPWESVQPDSPTANIAIQNADSGSLLNLYRRLIHLRRSNEALAAGRLIALTTGNPAVASYLRTTEKHAVLVVVNLGGAAASGVSIGSGTGALRSGVYGVRSLLGGTDGATLQVGADGQIRDYTPAPHGIGPRESLVLELTRR